MGRGGAIYFSYAALVLLSVASSASAGSSLWAVDIDESPAPSPEDGPPFSAHATRDRSLLPFQIIGIVGSYLASVSIFGTLLLTVGRSSRKRALEMASRPTEMVKPTSKIYDPSPMSPASWYSLKKLRSKKSVAASMRSEISNPFSPGMESVMSFDSNVLETDRQRRQDEMEKLYAAVMAQDERKSSQQALVTATEVPIIAPPQPPQAGLQLPQQKRPPRLATDAPTLRHLHAQPSEWSPMSPSTPKSPMRAIYPPDSPVPPMPSGPSSPIRMEYPASPRTPRTPQYFNQAPYPSDEFDSHHQARTPSFGSGRTIGSGSGSSPAGAGRKPRKSLRHLNISAPVQLREDNSDGARTPLSPRAYIDPGIPPQPPTARTVDSQWPTTPGTARTFFTEEDEELDAVGDLPQAYPNRIGPHHHAPYPPAAGATASTSPDTTEPRSAPKQPAGTTNRPLPLRQLALQQSQQSRDAYASAHPLSPMSWNHSGNPLSAGPVKTTFVEPKKDKLGAPRTGMATPYSAYMPFTPVTPVTPHLTTRAERRQRQRDQRRVQGVITEEDAVADEKDMWDSGY